MKTNVIRKITSFRFFAAMTVLCCILLFVCFISCDEASSDDDEINGTWTGLIISDEGQFPVPVIAELDSSEKTYSMQSFVHGKKDQLFEGSLSESGPDLHLVSHCDIQTKDGSFAPGTFSCECSMKNDVAIGTYSLRFDDETIAASNDEDGSVHLSKKDLGIAGTWKGGWSSEEEDDVNGTVTVIFNEDKTVSVTGTGFAFNGTWSVSEDDFTAESSGGFYDESDSHEGAYSATRKSNTLFLGKYTVTSAPGTADETTYTGVWALGKVIE